MSDKLVHVLFCMFKEVVQMESDWHWQKYNILEKEGIYYEFWKIWWSICATRIKNKVK